MVFADIKADGSVLTWGNALCCGDSLRVASLLTAGDSSRVGSLPIADAVQISGTASALAVIKAEGNIVTWADALHSGDS